jgi:hypothetical protein
MIPPVVQGGVSNSSAEIGHRFGRDLDLTAQELHENLMQDVFRHRTVWSEDAGIGEERPAVRLVETLDRVTIRFAAHAGCVTFTEVH